MGKFLAGLTVTLLIVAGVTVPAGARTPTVHVAALAGSVRDACTGLPIANPAVTVTKDPGPVQSPSHVGLGTFTYQTLDPGPDQRVLQVTAPGYAALGDPAAPGVTITRDPGPVGLPSPQAMSVGLVVKILLAPSVLPATCTPRTAPMVNALSGTVRDATTGTRIANPAVTVTRDPGPVQSPSHVGLGTFTYKTFDPGPTSLVLQVTGPGYAALGDPAAPGVKVTQDPGPISVPSPQAITIGTRVAILLAQAPPGT